MDLHLSILLIEFCLRKYMFLELNHSSNFINSYTFLNSSLYPSLLSKHNLKLLLLDKFNFKTMISLHLFELNLKIK